MNLSSKFRGCLVGGLLGDCLGAPFEGDIVVSKSVLNSYFKKLSDPSVKVPYKSYTDDTAMTKCIAHSLITEKEFNITDITKRFVQEYYRERGRGYGMNVVDVFAALRATSFKDVFAPAAIVFNGSGSFGNGAAMRVSPIALFCYPDPVEVLVDCAKQSALVTHANRLGYNGAILQCLAVSEALRSKDESLDYSRFLDALIATMKKVETFTEDEIVEGAREIEQFIYVKVLEKIRLLLDKSEDIPVSEVISHLGNGIAAHRSVPTAIYAFLRAHSPIPDVLTDNAFQRTIHYAIAFGGDTDTIAAMAGNIAGAYYGVHQIPVILQNHCESIKEMTNLGDSLYKLKAEAESTTN